MKFRFTLLYFIFAFIGLLTYETSGQNNTNVLKVNFSDKIIRFDYFSNSTLVDDVLSQEIARFYHDSLPLENTLVVSKQLFKSHKHLTADGDTALSMRFLKEQLISVSVLSLLGYYSAAFDQIEKIYLKTEFFNQKDKFYYLQLAYIISEKTGNVDFSLTVLKKLAMEAENSGDTSLIVFSHCQITRLYLNRLEPDKARLFFRAAQATIDTSYLIPLILKTQEIRLSSLANIGQLEKEKIKSRAEGLLEEHANDPDISSYAELLQLIYYLSEDHEQKLAILQIAQYYALNKHLSGFKIWTKHQYMDIFRLVAPDQAFYVLHEISEIFDSLNRKKETQLNQIFIDWKTNGDEYGSLKSEPNNKLFIWIALLLFQLSIIIFLLLKFIRHRSVQQKSFIDLSDSISQSKGKLQLIESNLEKRIEERIQVLEEELKERERVDQELKTALLKAEDANYLKNAFLANMSHEIRTPLNGIMGFANLLELELAMIEKPELFEYANSIQKSGERLLHLLNNIIDISRIEANDLTMNISPISLKPIVDQVIELNSFRANEKGIKIVADIHADQIIVADRDTIFRVFNEIIDNSIKYTEKGYIKFEVGKEPKGKFITIGIKDTGIGIDSAYLPYIFEAFRQESLGYTRQYQGAGLGLPLAKRLMNLMGGQLEVFSEKTIGTTIEIQIPTNEIDFEHTKIQKLENKDFERTILPKDIKILVIEDDQSSRIVLSKMLEIYGDVKSVPDGDSALKQIQNLEKENHHFEILFVDINLPAPWDGIRLREFILKKYPFYQQIPFVAQTAYAMSGDRERILESGFDYYISKPVNHHMILEAMNTFHEKIYLSRSK